MPITECARCKHLKAYHDEFGTGQCLLRHNTGAVRCSCHYYLQPTEVTA